MRDADFSPGALHLVATGTLTAVVSKKKEGPVKLLFEIPGTKQPFVLVSPPAEKPDNEKKQEDLLPQLRAKFAAGQRRFTISGVVLSDKGAALRLTVEHFEETADAKP